MTKPPLRVTTHGSPANGDVRLLARLLVELDRGPEHASAYWFQDQPGNRQRVDVIDDAGELRARFEDEEGLELIPVMDMAGTWAPI